MICYKKNPCDIFSILLLCYFYVKILVLKALILSSYLRFSSFSSQSDIFVFDLIRRRNLSCTTIDSLYVCILLLHSQLLSKAEGKFNRKNNIKVTLRLMGILVQSCSSPRWGNLPSGHQRNPLLGLKLRYMYWGQKHFSEKLKHTNTCRRKRCMY